VAGAPSVEAALYEKYLLNTGIKIVYDATYPLLTNAHTAVVTSGTATLETALFNVPQVVIYKTHNLTYRIAKLFLNFRFFSLVNLIYGDEAVKELLQVGLAEKIRTELNLLLEEEDYRQKIQESYAKIKTLLGGPGASERIAAEIQTILR
jgi:lipid-A-disaccharide synthase